MNARNQSDSKRADFAPNATQGAAETNAAQNANKAAEPGLLPLANRVTEEQAASYLGVTRGTLRNWRSAGKGPPFYRVMSRVFYVRRDLEAFLMRCRVDPLS